MTAAQAKASARRNEERKAILEFVMMGFERDEAEAIAEGAMLAAWACEDGLIDEETMMAISSEIGREVAGEIAIRYAAAVGGPQ